MVTLFRLASGPMIRQGFPAPSLSIMKSVPLAYSGSSWPG